MIEFTRMRGVIVDRCRGGFQGFSKTRRRWNSRACGICGDVVVAIRSFLVPDGRELIT